MTTTIDDILDAHGIEVSDEELAHYGIPGMKWGRRKARKAAKKAAAEAEAAKPKLKDLSDDELKARINRLKLEKEYRTLTAPQVSLGRKVVQELLVDVGKTQAKDVLNREVGKAISKAMIRAAARRGIRP